MARPTPSKRGATTGAAAARRWSSPAAGVAQQFVFVEVAAGRKAFQQVRDGLFEGPVRYLKQLF